MLIQTSLRTKAISPSEIAYKTNLSMRIHAGLTLVGLMLFGCLNTMAADINIVSYGAKGDAKTLNTLVIQRAIDACSAAKGGKVVVPPGSFLTGTLFLKNDVTLYLERGAILLGSTNIKDYKPDVLVRATNAENIGVSGPGIIDGQGYAFWKRLRDSELSPNIQKRKKFAWVASHQYAHKEPAPNSIINFTGCRRVMVEDVTLRNSESWTMDLRGCDNVIVRGVTIRNPFIGPNTDGIDIHACSNVRISDCDIYTSDDAICLKNLDPVYSKMACRNITVTNCILATVCNAFKIGTGSMGDFENIVFSNSVIATGLPSDELAREALTTVDPAHKGNPLAPICGIALETVDGGTIRGVTISNIVMQGVRSPIFLRIGNRGGRPRVKVADPKPGRLENVMITNVVAYGASTASVIAGLPGSMVENVNLNNIQIHTSGGGSSELAAKVLPELAKEYPTPVMWGEMPASGFFIRHAKGLDFTNVKVYLDTPDQRPLLTFDDVNELFIQNLKSNEKSQGETIMGVFQFFQAAILILLTTVSHCPLRLQALRLSTFRALGMFHRWPESFSRCWTTVLWAASMGPEPISQPFSR